MDSKEQTTLQIIYRDETILAVNKPSGLIVHRGYDRDPVTVADIVRDDIIGAPVHAIHRLDRGTSGVLIFALNADAARDLQVQIQNQTMKKRYITLVRGPMREPCVLDHAIPNKKDGERVDAVTEFQPLAHKDRWTLVEARPLTGRLHQIRRHLKHLSLHVVGDVRYGKGDVNRFFRETYGLNRLALHSFEVKINNAQNREITLTAPIPDDLLKLFLNMELLPCLLHAY